MHSRMIAWDDLKSFLALARHGSQSAAARALRVNQSTIGRRLRALEDALGTRLFDVVPDGHSLTAAGEALLTHAERIEDEIARAELQLMGGEQRMEGTIRITAPELFGVGIVVPLLVSFRKEHPGVEVELLGSNRTASLVRREADLALRLFRPDESDLVTRHVADVAFALYASSEYLRGRNPERGFPGHDLVSFDRTFQPTLEMEWLAQHAAGARVVMRVSSPVLALEAARQGAGLALLPCFAADRAGLERVAHDVLKRELWLVVRDEARKSARVRGLIDHLIAGLAALEPVLRGSSAEARRT
jgi:DNA-binding transcriptional LysR family regulator